MNVEVHAFGCAWDVYVDHDPGLPPSYHHGGTPPCTSGEVEAIEVVDVDELLECQPFGDPGAGDPRAQRRVAVLERLLRHRVVTGRPLGPMLWGLLAEAFSDDVERQALEADVW